MKKTLFITLPVLLAAGILCIFIVPRYRLVYNLLQKDNSSQRSRFDRGFIEWWYFDGIIDDKLNFVITFWTSTEKNFVELTLHDASQKKPWIYHREFPCHETKTSREHCDVILGENRILEENGTYTITVEDEHISFKCTFIPTLMPYGIKISSPLEYFTFQPWIAIPRGKIRGVIDCAYVKKAFQTQGYHDHNYFPQRSFFPPLASRGWYWGRFFTKDYTIVMTQMFDRTARSTLTVFKGSSLAYSANEKYGIFSKEIMKEVNKKTIPRTICIDRSAFNLLVSHRYASRETKLYTRFVSSLTLTTEPKRNDSQYSGTGLSEFVYLPY